MGKPKAKVEKDTAERWLLTYADLMNLLLIFFIILYTISQTDVAKFNQLAESLREAFGESTASSFISESGAGTSIIPLENTAPSPVIPSTLEDQQMEEVKEKVTEIIKNENLTGEVEVSMQERGVLISIKEKVLFKSGSAEIEPESRQTVEKLGGALKIITGNHMRVEGHTDNDPINTAQFPSNWELSLIRATNVLHLLVDKSGVDPTIISPVGYGEFRPKLPNTTPENKAANRRVDIVIVRNVYDKSEAGADSLPANSPAAQSGSEAGAGEAAGTQQAN